MKDQRRGKPGRPRRYRWSEWLAKPGQFVLRRGVHFGFSMGAMTALAFATRDPARLASALIAGIDAEPEPRTSIATRAMDPERIDREEPAWATQLERRHGPVQGEGAWRRLMGAMAAAAGRDRPLTPADHAAAYRSEGRPHHHAQPSAAEPVAPRWRRAWVT